MLKSELIQRISSQNPHLYQRDMEKIVSTVLDEIVEALRRGDRVELRGFGALRAGVQSRALRDSIQTERLRSAESYVPADGNKRCPFTLTGTSALP
jgi:integration host factor subunit beta